MKFQQGQWSSASSIQHPRDFTCGYCGNQVGSNFGYSYGDSSDAVILICPRCWHATLFEGRVGGAIQFPAPLPGDEVSNISAELHDLYTEARRCAGAAAFTAAVMLCRKMLMNIAVTEGDREGRKFAEYIDFLEKQSFFSPKSKVFVAYIRDLGNEANHEIKPKSQEDALAALDFVAALLHHNYELPSKVPGSALLSTNP